MNVHRAFIVSACGLGIGGSLLGVAQLKGEEGKPAAQTAQRGDRMTSEQTLATCIAIANQEEIAISKFAAEKAKHSDVKEFAQMLVKDHQSFLQKLQRYAPEATRDGYLQEKRRTDSDDRRTSGNESSGKEADRKVQPAGNDATEGSKVSQANATKGQNTDSNQIDAVQLHREIAEECLQSAKQELGKKDGEEFDKCFIGHQIAMHAGMKNKLVVFQRHVKGDLNQLIGGGIETTEKHMKKAEEIMKSLDKNDSK